MCICVCLPPVSGTDFLNFLELLLGDQSIFCSNEVTLGGLLDGGAGQEKDQAMIRSLEFEPCLLSSRERRGTTK